MTHWLAPAVTLTVTMCLWGCQSSPTPNWAAEKIGFTRAHQLGSSDQLWIMNGDGSGQTQLNVGADGNSSMT